MIREFKVQKKHIDAAYNFLLQRYPNAATKTEIGEAIGIKSERRIRYVLSYLAQTKPVIATSDHKGYMIAQKDKDYDKALHTWKELSSRIEELEKRIKPLIKFIDNHSGRESC